MYGRRPGIWSKGRLWRVHHRAHRRGPENHQVRGKLGKQSAQARVRLDLACPTEPACGRGEVSRVHTRDLLEGGGGAQLVVHSKGSKERVVPISDSLAESSRRGAAGHTPGAPRDGWLFPSRTGGHLQPYHAGQLVVRVLSDGWTMHTLRHRSSRRAHRGTRNLRAVEMLLGHSSIRDHQAILRCRRRRDPSGDGSSGGRRMSGKAPDMSPETDRLLNELADRQDVLPPAAWSPGFIKAMTALFDLYIGDQLHERPAPVLQLVGPKVRVSNATPAVSEPNRTNVRLSSVRPVTLETSTVAGRPIRTREGTALRFDRLGDLHVLHVAEIADPVAENGQAT
jgi:hypothetical protein